MKYFVKAFYAVAYICHTLYSVFRARAPKERKDYEPDYYNKADESGNPENEE